MFCQTGGLEWNTARDYFASGGGAHESIVFRLFVEGEPRCPPLVPETLGPRLVLEARINPPQAKGCGFMRMMMVYLIGVGVVKAVRGCVAAEFGREGGLDGEGSEEEGGEKGGRGKEGKNE